jgi:SecD/SecF fusion protein
MNPLNWLMLAANEYRLINFKFPVLFEGSLNLPSQWLIVLGLLVGSIVGGYALANAARQKEFGWKFALIFCSTLLSLFLVLFGEYKLGVDLKGGVILVYEIDKVQTASLHPKGRSDDWDMNALVQKIRNRLNPDGLKEIVVRPFGPEQVEIVVPETDPGEIEKIKIGVETAGVLQFMVVASEAKDSDLLEVAQAQAALPDDRRLKRDVVDASGVRRGYWATLGRENKAQEGGALAPFRELDSLREGFIRDSRTGQLIELTPRQRAEFSSSSPTFQAFIDSRGIKDVEVLMVYDAAYDLRGDDLAQTNKIRDQSLRPAISFSMKGQGITKMGTLTQENLKRKLAIIFDNTLLSAPVIQSRIDEHGQITGNFTDEEVQFIVEILRAGSMPVVLKKNPISENRIGSILGRDTIEKGSWSIVVSLVLVLGFVLVYYRFSGFVACFALVLNILLTVGIMIILRAPFTLPGLAGLVLTVGMSVDSNVLIYERIREEMAKGTALRMAIRNGFDRAMVTIIDSNLTTLLTAVVLYAIGTDQVRGFGITLILGIMTSFFTAIFVARAVLEFGERALRWKYLSMTHFLTNPQVDWCSYLKPALIGSTAIILVGLVATVLRGPGIFDIDLVGGSSVAWTLKEPIPEDTVRAKLAEKFAKLVHPDTKGRVDFTVHGMEVKNEQPNTVYKVDSSLPEDKELQRVVREAFQTPDGKDGLRTYQVAIGTLKEEPLAGSAPGSTRIPEVTPPAEKPESPTPAESPAKPAESPKPAAEPKPADKPTETKPAEEKPAAEKPAESKPAAEKPAAEKPADKPAESAEKPAGCGDDPPPAAEAKEAVESKTGTEPKAESTPRTETEPKPAAAPASEAKPAEKPAEGAPPSSTDGAKPAENTPTTPGIGEPSLTEPKPSSAAPAKPRVKTTTTLRFVSSPVSADAVKQRVKAAAVAAIQEEIDLDVNNPNWNGTDNSAFEEWTVTLPLPKDRAQLVLDRLKSQLEQDVVWQTSSKIGGQVSTDTRYRAIGAIFVSLIGILAYLWFRFQKAIWGVAAIVALAHDALIMLCGIAVSYWLAGFLGFAQVEEFKISLPVVAAFLTLIGFSVNDTIVIFDRIREIRGKSPDVTAKMINDAVNQTMSRTILTSGTVLITVIILYFFGGPGIHAFAFAMVCGVISGTYSTVFIAAPLVLWLLGKPASEASRRAAREERGASANGGAGGTLPTPTRTV